MNDYLSFNADIDPTRCPFCNSSKQVKIKMGYTNWYECGGCNCKVDVNHWSNRPKEQELSAEIKRLNEVIRKQRLLIPLHLKRR